MYQEKKKYLKQYLLQEKRIKRMEEMLIISPEKSEEYISAIKAANCLREKIEAEIKAVDGGILSELLFQKYVFGRTLEEIGIILNYSKRHIERLHISALEKFNN